MRRSFPKWLLLFLAFPSLWLAACSLAQNETAPQAEYSRPRYNLHLNLDYQLLTFTADGTISIPVKNGDAIQDAVFFIYANAPGVSGNDESHHNVVVDEVLFAGQKTEYSQSGAVLRVKLPQAQTRGFDLKIKWRGVVPRAPAGSGGLLDAMGGMDLGGLLSGAATPKKDPDYGVYSYGSGVLSLGSFWYPSLAVRQNGKWIDEAPSGVGDVGFSEASDFDVLVKRGNAKSGSAFPWSVVATGDGYYDNSSTSYQFLESKTRDFSILASDQFVEKGKLAEIAGKPVGVAVYVAKTHASKADKVLDIAAKALEIYSKKFGAYPYDSFKVVEGPMRGGAGGMEYSGLVSIASFLFDDMDKQIQQLAGALGVNGLDKMLGDLGLNDAENGGGGGAAKNDNPAQDLLGGMLGQQKAIFDSLLEMTIAHEVAHQWWAMGVGSDAQRAPWVDESLTNYSAIVYFEERYGNEKAQEMLEMHLKSTYSMGRMLGGADAKVNLATTEYSNSMQYGAIVYGKGALFYDALRKLVGDDAFFGALREYYAKYNGRLAPSVALLEIMKAKAPARKTEIQNLYARWIESTHGDEDIAGGKVAGVEELLGGLLGGMMGGAEE